MGVLKVKQPDGTWRNVGCPPISTAMTLDFPYHPPHALNDQFVVPLGVRSLTVEAWGSQGGGAAGGLGGHVKATISVTPGETLTIFVGGQASYNGGGDIGHGWSSPGNFGGGATDIRQGGTALANRVVVAAGGGGASAFFSGVSSPGGAGGAALGGDGGNGLFSATGGKGATTVAGGAGGAPGGGAFPGGAGSLGQGGAADVGSSGVAGIGSGGGGGGYYGGGGGGGEHSGGGGGSNWTSGTVLQNDQGVRASDGLLRLTWTQPPAGRLKLWTGLTWVREQCPDDQEFLFDPFTAADGTPVNGYNGWSTATNRRILANVGFDGGFASVQDGQQPDQGTLDANGFGLVLRPDGVAAATGHHIHALFSSYGSRGHNPQGLIWGYNGPNDYFFACLDDWFGAKIGVGYWDGTTRHYLYHAGAYSDGTLYVDHDFLSGRLTVRQQDEGVGTIRLAYTGIHPHTVANGKIGFYSELQAGGAFWGASIVDDFYNDVPISRPLKLWTGSAWVVGACMVPLYNDDQIMQDSPWGYWPLTEATSVFNDVSGNGNSMVVTGAPLRAQPGPRGSSVYWPDAVAYANTPHTLATSDVTVEAWVRIEAMPTADTAIIGMANAFGGGTFDKVLYVNAGGVVIFYWYDPAYGPIAMGICALALDTWTHVAATVGGSGVVVYQNGLSVNTYTPSTHSYSGGMQVFLRGGGGNVDQSFTSHSPLSVAEPVIYAAQLPDERILAHYTAT